MSWRKKFMSLIVSFIVGVVVFDFLAAITATQFVLKELSNLGVEISLQTRMTTTFYDIFGLAPTFSPIFGFGFIIAFFVAAQLAKRTNLSARGLFAAAGFFSVLATLMTMEAVFGLWPIAAAREITGLICLSLCGVPAGYVFFRLHTAAQKAH